MTTYLNKMDFICKLAGSGKGSESAFFADLQDRNTDSWFPGDFVDAYFDIESTDFFTWNVQ